jgi:hypothetical protein
MTSAVTKRPSGGIIIAELLNVAASVGNAILFAAIKAAVEERNGKDKPPRLFDSVLECAIG